MQCDVRVEWQLVIRIDFSQQFGSVSCRRRCGGGMSLRTGSHGRGVEHRVTVIMHIDVFS